MANTFSLDDAGTAPVADPPAKTFGLDEAMPPPASNPKAFSLEQATQPATVEIKTNPYDLAKAQGMQDPYANTSDFLSAIANNSLGFVKSVPASALKFAGGMISAVSEQPYLAAADAVSKAAGDPEYGGNLKQAWSESNPDEPLPVDKFFSDVSKTSRALGVVGKISKGIAETAPMMGVAALPAAAQSLVVRGFTADMLAHAPGTAVDLYKELKKPDAEQDPDKVTSLISDFAQQMGFGALGAAHEVAGLQKALVDKYVPRGQGMTGTLPQTFSLQAALDPDAIEKDLSTPSINQQPTESSPPPAAASPIPSPTTPPAEPATASTESPAAVSEPVQTDGGETPVPSTTAPESRNDSEIPLLPVDVTDAQIKAMRMPTPERAPDILDTIGDHFPKGVQFADKADFGEYLNNAQGAAKDLMSHTEGEPADKVLDGLHLEGQFQHLDSVDDLAQAMVDAGKARIGERAGVNDQARELAQDQVRQQMFDDANKASRAGVESVPVENLFVGDTFKLNGQPMKVTGFATDADTGKPFGAELEGAYGQRMVPLGKALHLDEGTLQAAIPVAGGRVAASGTSVPRPAKPLATPPVMAATPAPVPHPISQYFQTHANNIKSVIAPQALVGATDVANALRHFMGENAMARARADEALKPFHADFDKTPVPENYRYSPTQPLPHNYAIIDAFERDPKSLPARYQQLGAIFQKEFAQRIDAIQKFAPDALQKLITNYFPHVWEDPKRAEGVMAQTATRLFAGRKEFLKQRSLPFFRDGLERGLKPVSDNPVDLLLAKMDSMDKMLLALKAQAEFKKSGAMKFNYALEKTPDGWEKVNDPAFVVNTPPEVTIKEAFDAQLRTRTQEFLQKLGVPEKRLATLGGKRWGMAYESPEQIKTRFGGPMSVYWHELGHIMDYRYNLQRDFLKQGNDFDQQLRNLADRRLPANYPKTRAVLNKQTGRVVNRPTSMTSYVRNNYEKMAVMSEAYVHAPDVFKRVAPLVYDKFDQFIDAHPELQDIREIKPSLRLDTAETTQKLGGILKLGDWIMPSGPAQVMKNYLSPSLSRNSLYRSFKSASNILNAAQLGLSGFHLGFTSLDAATSRLAIGIEDAANGDLARAGKTFASVPFSPLTNILKGRQIRQEALHPGSTDADTAALVKALELAGGRIGADKFWQTDFTRRLKVAMVHTRQSFNALDPYHTAKAGARVAWNAPFSVIELAMKPIMDYVVPRQKLGVFADMAQRELERLGPNASVQETREAMRKAWDSVDNRMGQVVYDNLFYNRMAKDMALASFRAYGWQLGKYREGFGALVDTGKAVKQLTAGQKPEVTRRMAYALALPLMVGAIGGFMNYIMTGHSPKEWRDWFMPRTGGVDTNGNAARVNLPSYMKDALAYAKHPITSLAHSLNPMFSGIYDLLENKDFYGTQIRDPDDPLWKQGSDVAKYAGKQFVPFSVSGIMQLHEQAAPIQKEILPFFGITPVPMRMTMTPAQELAADITGANMPSAPRTQEQFDRSKLIKEIVQDFRNGQNTAGRTSLAQGFQTGQLNANTVKTIIDKMKLTPLQFQVHHMEVPTAMRVWRIANPQERTQLTPMLELKVAASKTLTAAEMKQYTTELHTP